VPLCLARSARAAQPRRAGLLKGSSTASHSRCANVALLLLSAAVPRSWASPRPRRSAGSRKSGTPAAIWFCCGECNSQKGEMAAEDFLRSLFRQPRITLSNSKANCAALDALASGSSAPSFYHPSQPGNRRSPNLYVVAGLSDHSFDFGPSFRAKSRNPLFVIQHRSAADDIQRVSAGSVIRETICDMVDLRRGCHLG